MNDRIRKMGEDSRRLAKVTVDPDLCMGCQKCIRTCCYDVYKWDKEKKLSVAAYSTHSSEYAATESFFSLSVPAAMMYINGIKKRSFL